MSQRLVDQQQQEGCRFSNRTGSPFFPTNRRINLRRELVNRAVVVRATVDGCAVEISRRIGHHSVVGKSRVGNTGETISHSLCPVPLGVSLHLEDGAAAAPRATLTGRAVQSAVFAENQIADGTHTVLSTLEA